MGHEVHTGEQGRSVVNARGEGANKASNPAHGRSKTHSHAHQEQSHINAGRLARHVAWFETDVSEPLTQSRPLQECRVRQLLAAVAHLSALALQPSHPLLPPLRTHLFVSGKHGDTVSAGVAKNSLSSHQRPSGCSVERQLQGHPSSASRYLGLSLSPFRCLSYLPISTLPMIDMTNPGHTPNIPSHE